MLVNGQLRNGTGSSSANNGGGGGGGGDGDKIRQLQRLLLGVTKAIQTYLLEDIGREASWGQREKKRILLILFCAFSDCYGIYS